MKYGLILTCAMLLASSACPADEINVSAIPYTKVKITGFDGKMVSFTTFSGKTIKKDIAQVRSLVVTDDQRFTEAEKMVALGRLHAAIRVYEAAARLATEQWRKDLITFRLNLARGRAIKTTGGNGKTPGPKKCTVCGGTGKMRCGKCSTGDQATSKTKCRPCRGTGRATCPQCLGKWQLDTCFKCKGKGTRPKFDWKWNTVLRKIEPTKTLVTCERCAGKGCTRICQTCGGATGDRQGTTRCPTCQGSGTTATTCPGCKGTKKVTCTFCNGTGIAKKGTIAVKPTNGDNGRNPDHGGSGKTTPPPVSGPLDSPDALVASLMTEPKHPSQNIQVWAKLSIAQRDGAEEIHARAMVKWLAENDFFGKTVTWSATFTDVAKAPGETGYLVNAHTPAGVQVRASVPSDPQWVARKLKKGAKVRVRGTIKQYALVDDATATKRVYRVSLADATVAPE